MCEGRSQARHANPTTRTVQSIRAGIIWQSPGPRGHIAFDACSWTPWETLTTAERERAARRGLFAAGRTFVLRLGDGNTRDATGAYTWVPFTVVALVRQDARADRTAFGRHQPSSSRIHCASI